MSRAKGWFTLTVPSGSVMIDSFDASVAITPTLVDPTLLRTRVWAELSYADENVPPVYPGNGSDPYVLRMVATDAGGAPSGSWWADAEGPDDVVFSPFQWSDTWLLPADIAHGNPRTIFSTARLDDGVAESQGMRKLPGSQKVVYTWHIGPLLGATSGANPLFTLRMWIRALVEATI